MIRLIAILVVLGLFIPAWAETLDVYNPVVMRVEASGKEASDLKVTIDNTVLPDNSKAFVRMFLIDIKPESLAIIPIGSLSFFGPKGPFSFVIAMPQNWHGDHAWIMFELNSNQKASVEIVSTKIVPTD